MHAGVVADDGWGLMGVVRRAMKKVGKGGRIIFTASIKWVWTMAYACGS